jgi:uncharacterized protein (TIGR02246 family)
MKSILVKTALTALAMLLCANFSALAQTASNHDADSAAINQFVTDFVNTWNNHDAHGAAAHYVEDGEFTSVKGDVSHGRKELEEHYTTIFSTFLKNARTTDTVRSIRFLGPDLASVDLEWLVNEPSAPNGVLRKGLLTWVLTKRNGQWLVLVYHEFAF